ncbi:hypothetical protein ACFL31_02695 [Candidatus Margulisiibacteriota bacterium]
MMYGTGMVWGSLTFVLLLLGFAYIIWVLSNKESGNIKSAGQIIAIVIAVIAAIILLYGTLYSGVMGRGGWCGGRKGKGSYGMMGKKMSSQYMMKKVGKMSDEGRMGMMQEMAKDPEMRKEMQECLEK